jgi:DNA-binding transcriptional ArsR family regulator
MIPDVILNHTPDAIELAKGEIQISRSNAKIVRDAFITLTHPDRVKLMQLIYESETQELTVTQLYIGARIEQSVASQHLRRLRTFLVVNPRPDGKEIYYSVDETFKLQIETAAAMISRDKTYETAINICRALNNERRIEILQYLDSWGPKTVGSIYRWKVWEQSATSIDLRDLRNAGLVIVESRGKNRYYQVNYTQLKRVVNLINKLAEAIREGRASRS